MFFRKEELQKLLKRHGFAGPLLCGVVIFGSLYGTYKAISQMRTEWQLIVKNSRQDWKRRIAPDIHS